MKLLIAMTIAAVAATAAAAHEVQKGPNGGRVADAADYHVELVTKDRAVQVYLTDQSDKPVAAAGHKGLAILAIAGKSQRIVLAPEGNRLAGEAAAAVQGQPKGVVQITTPQGRTVQARFN